LADAGFQKVTIACPSTLVDVIANFLIERSSRGVVLEDGSDREDTKITAYIDRNRFPDLTVAEVDCYFKAIAANFDNPSYRIIESCILQNKDWLACWKESFQPIRITEHIVICPSWAKQPPVNNELIITIDPGAAFGTGHHETTANCIKTLEKIGCRNKKVLDYGCGTAILAIVACKLGASKVYAVDNDPAAVECAKANMTMNQVEFGLFLSDDYIAPERCDLVAANLTTEQIVRSFELLDKSLSDDGWLILSGILNEEDRRISRFIEDHGFHVVEKFAGDEWLTLALRRA